MRTPEKKEPEKLFDIPLTREKFQQLITKLKALRENPVVMEGAEASLRTAINVIITVGDAIPGLGTIASWGADATKIWAHIQYKKERERVKAAGGDPETVKMSKINLTPDVDLSTAIFSEFLEPLCLGLLPSHGIESGLQFYKKDWNRISQAIEVGKNILQGIAEPSPDVQDAANVFSVDLTNDEL